MNRRTVLKTLAAVPIVALAKPALARVEPDVQVVREDIPQRPDNVTFYGDDWKAMAEHLWRNFQAFRAKGKQDWWSEDDLKIMEPVSYRFCKNLLVPEGWYPDMNPRFGEDLAAPFFTDVPGPAGDPHLISKNVLFGVSDREVTYKSTTRATFARKLKMGSIEGYRAAMEDLRAYHGIDAEVEMVAMLGHEAALEVLHEVRSDWRLGGCPTRYVLHLPPHVTPTDPKLAKDGSFRRGWRIRYAKWA